MLDALFGFIFEIVLSAVGTVIAKLFGVEDAVDFAPGVIGLGLIGIGVAAAVWGH
ncbi:hypothetical protein [Bradyrhizobium sp. BR13661]|jgi:hypothetical protein|uniref:hypothetical protein n=1 Tax=Bradyrhizobium sp. BR13661 TaxID=2940622 RepID=UPI0024748444|nr:hypothetical protein [Bradyrhizobium sp. BR13661]MDH6259059.1 hypothetical protein [Bradyrhizobium sp. BR13661]